MRYLVTQQDVNAERLTLAVCSSMDDALDVMSAHVGFDSDMHSGREYVIVLEEDD